jgi:site-specific DNA-methyltransferase (adenine-specific)
MVGDCRELMAGLADESVDAIVTDPPYELGFMGKSWDASGIAYDLEVWRQALRVLKPGGHLLAFSGSRTYHRMVCAIEDAGFEIRDQIMWLYGSGFPKSHNLAGDWSGWGTALKPAHEPIVVARKPFKGTVAANVLAHGTGALNIDGCRVGTEIVESGRHGRKSDQFSTNAYACGKGYAGRDAIAGVNIGRWPANVIHDGSDEVTSGIGEAARFFYCAKASQRDREEGLDGFEAVRTGGMQSTADGSMLTGSGNERTTTRANHHPTVKPTDLMRYLCRLVTPPGGLVLDPFTGSGSTGKAAVLEGFRFLGCELSEEYAAIARARIAAAQGPGARSQGPDTP